MHKLTKISLHEDRELDSKYVPVGATFKSMSGDALEPVVGECYFIGGWNGLRTSIIKEVRNVSPGKRLLKTMNSYYLLEELDEENN